MGRVLLKPALFVALLGAFVLVTSNANARAASSGAESSGARLPGLKKKVGWGPLSSKQAKALVKKTRSEARPRNKKANRTVPTKAQIKHFRANSDMPYARWVNGRYRGTTDDIIEWAARKWGLPPDLLRAVAVHETWWDNNFVGDNGDSFGIFQVRRPYHCCLPFTRDSTAFNADYYGGIIRSYYDGKQPWLNNPDVRIDNLKVYRPGDIWGSVGAWYSGRWHTAGNTTYVKAVKKHMRERTWDTHPYFDGFTGN